MPLGDYEGRIFIFSNDPDLTEIEIPVYFHVDFASGENFIAEENIQISNYPNPFADYTTFDIYIPDASYIELVIYNFNGQKICTLIKDYYTAGSQTAIWNGSNSQGIKVKSGIYFYRLKMGDYEIMKKIILIDE